MDLDFGHGLIPRIGEENYKAVDRCVGPTDLFSTALDLPWAIVDGAWAEQKPELLGTLREHGTSLLVDTHGWRFRHESAFDVGKLTAASWAPTSPLLPGDRTANAAFVQASLRALRALGVDAADAGLAIGEGFDQSTTKRRAKPDPEEGQKRGGRRSRMYLGQIGRSLEAADIERLLAVPGAAAELRSCRLPCHRFSESDGRFRYRSERVRLAYRARRRRRRRRGSP